MKSLAALAIGCLSLGLFPCTSVTAQSRIASDKPLTVQSNLVLLPVLVKTKSGEIVFSLTTQDFLITDNGVPQSAQMQDSMAAQPVAIALLVQTGGGAVTHLKDYVGLDAVLDALIGDVPHHVAVVAFDSKPHLTRDFSADTDAASAAVSGLQPGDSKAAILDAIKYSGELLGKQPAEYRRVIVLLSETIDAGNQANLEEVIREVNDTNITVYSFGFSSTKAGVSHEATKPKRPGGSPYHGDAYAAGGCMSRDPDADPDAGGSRAHQAFDCATDLLPPLRLGRMAFVAATDSLKHNVPESVARMTGGEYFPFKNAKTLRQGIVSISSDLPNYYMLSLRPESPSPGPHLLQVRLRDRPDLRLQSRTLYWVEAPDGQ